MMKIAASMMIIVLLFLKDCMDEGLSDLLISPL